MKVVESKRSLFRLVTGLIVLVVGTGVENRLLVQGQEPEFRPQRLLPPIAPIVTIPIRAVRDVRDTVGPSELVIAVTIGKDSRAYPINMLTGPQREILNDTLGGKAIAVTW